MSSPSRLAYLDTTKGILVLLMVVYHSLNYTSDYHLSFRYLCFLPLSFIVITGFLLSIVYTPRYRPGDPTLKRRLLLRGLRLIALFTLLNVAAQFARSPVYGRSVGLEMFFDDWLDVFVVGGSRVAAFDVLLPIAYLLVIAPWLIAVSHARPRFLPWCSGVLIVLCGALDFSGYGLPNLNFLAAGIVGMLAGQLLPDASILGRFFWLTLLGYALYMPLGIAEGVFFLVQFLGAFVALALIVAASVRLGEQGWLRQRIIRSGQYSLIAYIVQIALLQVTSRFFGRPDIVSLPSAVQLFGTLALMVAVIEATAWLRGRVEGIDRAYKAVFA